MTAAATPGPSSTGPLLARLGESYVHRAEPSGSAPRIERRGEGAPRAEEDGTVACTVLAVATVDDERRWVWPVDTGRTRPAAVALRARSGYIEVRVDPTAGPALRNLDCRGRLRLPTGILRWAGLGVGARLALVAHGDVGGPLFLVPASALLTRWPVGS